MGKMNNRVYGVVGIKSKLASWNADFTGKPRTTSDGSIFGSDKAFKYPIKKMWEAEGKKVLYVKSFKCTENIDKKSKAMTGVSLKARALAERFEQIFGAKLEEIKDKRQIVRCLFSAIDVQNFGATFTESGNNISITGAVQVGQGLNKYEDSTIEIMDILSPFVNTKSGEEKNNTSIGKKIVSNEAHYFYPFSINPENYNIYTSEIEDLDGYTKEAYDSFKNGCLVAATAYNTNSKAGCENELAIFVECKENSKLYLANLDEYIKFKKQEEKDIIDVTELMEILNKNEIKQEIEKVEIYYNPYTTKLAGDTSDAIVKNLF